jgi:hypothetical protein
MYFLQSEYDEKKFLASVYYQGLELILIIFFIPRDLKKPVSFSENVQ